jgi:hypothetical protein
MDRRFWGGSAVVDSSGVSGWLGGRRRGGGEDPWLCDPGFRRVCVRESKVLGEIPYIPVLLRSMAELPLERRSESRKPRTRYTASMPSTTLNRFTEHRQPVRFAPPRWILLYHGETR